MFAPNRTRLNYLDVRISSPLKPYDSFGFRTGKKHYLNGNAIIGFPLKIRIPTAEEVTDGFGGNNLASWNQPGFIAGDVTESVNGNSVSMVGLLTFSFANHNVTTATVEFEDDGLITFTLPTLNIFGDGTPNANTPITLNVAGYYGYFESEPGQFFTYE